MINERLLMRKAVEGPGEGENLMSSPMESTLGSETHETTDAGLEAQASNEGGPSKKRRIFGKGGLGRMMALTLVFSLGFGFSSGVGAEYANQQWFKSTSGIFTERTSVAPGTVQLSDQTTGTDGEKRIVSIAESVAPSIVTITSKTQYKDFFDNPAVSKAAGSGVVFKIDGTALYIMTNNHVIDSATELLVQFNNGAKASGEVLGKDPITDLAIVKVKKSDIGKNDLTAIKVAVLGDSDKLQVGQTAVAIGNPLDYGTSVTVGVVSAINRKLENTGLSSYIQTDAAINPGNSGGALLNSSGEVVGINTIKISEPAVEGMGFAIPINSAKPILAQLFDKGFVSRPYLGIYGNTIDQQTSEMYNIPVGVLVGGVVAGSGSEKAGLKKGDVIIALDGVKVNSMDDLSTALKDKKVGETIKVKIVRESTTTEKAVKLTDRGKN